MTDNRTNEQIVAEALREGVHVAGGGRSHLAAADVTYALGKAGRLVDGQLSNPGQFTEAQVEAAAKAIADCHNPGMFEKYPENWRVEARAALVAAQGAAPAPSSGVDEDKLAEVIARLDWGYMVDGPSVSEIARAVVEWLKGGAR